MKKNQTQNPYQSIVSWFTKGNSIDIINDLSNKDYEKVLLSVPGLKELVKKYFPDEEEKTIFLLMEFALHGMAEFSLISRFRLESGLQFKDILSSMFTMSKEEDDETLTGTDYV